MPGRGDDLRKTEQLKPGDPCEFRFPARTAWNPGTVKVNGGSGYWTIIDAEGSTHAALYIEHVCAPGTNPWGS